MSTAAETFGIGIDRERQHEPPNTTTKVPPKYIGDLAHLTEDTMPPRRVNEDFDEAEDRHNFRLAMIAMARAVTDKPTPSRGESIKAWAPTMLTALVLAVGFVRYDTTRENKSGFELGDLRAKYEQVLVENRRYQNNVLMLEAYQRELERALIQAKANIKLPAFPVLQK